MFHDHSKETLDTSFADKVVSQFESDLTSNAAKIVCTVQEVLASFRFFNSLSDSDLQVTTESAHSLPVIMVSREVLSSEALVNKLHLSLMEHRIPSYRIKEI